MKTAVFALFVITGMAAATAAQAQVLESVRVRLPNGQVISIDDGDRRWWRDDRVVMYSRYYYDPADRVYVIQENPPPHPREGRWCPPGQAKKGRC